MRYHHKAEICCLCLQWDLIYFEAAEDLLWWFRTGRARRREKECQKNRESKKLPGKKHPCLLFESSLTMFVITRQRNWRLITLIARCRHFFDDVFFFTFWQKPSLFSVLSFVYVEFYIYIKLENMAYAFATNQNSTFKIQAELNWFRFVCVIWCVAEQNDGFEW